MGTGNSCRQIGPVRNCNSSHSLLNWQSARRRECGSGTCSTSPPQLPLTHPSTPPILLVLHHSSAHSAAQKLTGRAKDDSTVGKRTNSPIGRRTMVLLLQLPHTESVSRRFHGAHVIGGELRRRFHATYEGNLGFTLSEMYVGRTATETAGEEKKRKRVRRPRRREVVKYRNLNCLTLPGGKGRKRRGENWGRTRMASHEWE